MILPNNINNEEIFLAQWLMKGIVCNMNRMEVPMRERMDPVQKEMAAILWVIL